MICRLQFLAIIELIGKINCSLANHMHIMDVRGCNGRIAEKTNPYNKENGLRKENDNRFKLQN